MIKGTEQIGKRIVAFDAGEAFDRVKDVVFDYDTRRVLGFLVDEGGWFREAKLVPFSVVQAVGPDAIVVPSRKAAARPSENREAVRAVLGRSNVLKGTRILTTEGKDLGSMVDLYFDEATGAIDGYEVSGGMFADAYSGRGYVPAEYTLNVGKEVAFVPPETASWMDEQVGGVKGAVKAAGEKIQDASSAAGARLDQARQAAGSSMRDAARAVTDTTRSTADIAREKVLAASGRLASSAAAIGAAASAEEALGRRVRSTVPGDGGTIVAPVGMIVTDDVIARARMNGQEAALLEAVGLTPADALRSRARNAAGDSAAAVRDASGHTAATMKAGAARATEGAGNLLRRTKHKIEQMQEARHESRINDAIGRPVTRVVLDREDHVILNVGELVTNEAVGAARDARMLETMLKSVSREKPPLGPGSYMAPERGEASLDRHYEQAPRDSQRAIAEHAREAS